MNKIVLYKQVSNVQIGHLYEHIFCTQLAVLLRSNGLFSYVDYDLNAKSFYNGFIRLDVQLYSEQAKQQAELVDSIDIDFSEDEISRGLLQILAEKHADVKEYDDDVVEDLKRLHALPWIRLSQAHKLDKQKLTHAHLELTDRSPRHFGVLKQTISIPDSFVKKNYDLIPLFCVVAKALRLNLQEEIARQSICYSYDDEFKNSKSISDVNYYRIDKRQSNLLTDETITATELLQSMSRSGFVTRLSEFLMHANLESMQAPDDEEILKNTASAVGLEYWRRIGTESNITKVLNAISIEFSLGKSKDSIEIDSLNVFK